MDVPTSQEITSALGARNAEKGAAYQRDGRVAIDEVAEDCGRISAHVQGSEFEPYAVVISLRRDDRTLHIDDSCSCPIGRNCKHVAATLFELERRPREITPTPNAGRISALAPEIDSWLQQLDLARRNTGDEFTPEIRQRLLYLLSMPRILGAERLVVRSVMVRLLRDGQIAERSARDVLPQPAILDKPPRYLRASDLENLAGIQQMAQRREFYTHDGTVLMGPGSERLLEAMIRTGRCYWERPDNKPLALGPSRRAVAQWQAQLDGGQAFALTGVGIDAVLATSPPWYLDRKARLCGPIECDLPPAVLAALVAAPRIAQDAAGALAAELEHRFPGRSDLQPHSAISTRRVSGKPAIHLHVSTAKFKSHYSWQRHMALEVELILARLSFEYEDVRVPAALPGRTVTRTQGGAVTIISRNVAAETGARRELDGAGLKPGSGWSSGYRLDDAARGGWVMQVGSNGDARFHFATAVLPRLQATGWIIEFAKDWPFHFVELDGEFSIDLSESSGLDWFEFDLGVMVDGARVNLLPALVPLLGRFADEARGRDLSEALAELTKRETKMVIQLADGRRASLPVARLLPFLVAIMDLFSGEGLTKQGRVRLPRLRAAELAALEAHTLEATRLRWLGGEKLRELGRRLADFASIAAVAPPLGFAGELRGYQRDGLAWLQFLRGYDLNGILADDMGLGKTVQALGHLLIEKEQGRADRPSLVVAPTSLIPNWRSEAVRFAPDLRVVVWHGPDRIEAELPACDLVLTSYALLARDRELLARQPWHIVILDEAQAIKNPQALATQAVQTLEARHRLCLTGTPLENHLGELWSLMNFLNPGLLGDRTRFGREFRQPIEKRGDEVQRDALVRRVRPFMLRRTKDAVERDLPAKTEIVERLELERHQRDVYESVRLAAYGRVREEIAVRGLARSHIVVLDALLKLRQVCCDPRLLKLKHGAKAAGSAKLSRLMEMLPALLAEGRRVLVFSQFTSMLALIEPELIKAEIPFIKLTGETVDRTTPVRRFQGGEVPVFLISLKAGGVGLNLTAADTVILYDPWWNPAVEMQAIDRAHRIGQDKPVFAYRLLTIGTVEEKMLELQSRKRALADALLSGSATATSQITEADLDALFAPAGGQ